MKARLTFLDGHRGLAILMVIGYHAYSRWPKLVPYGDSFANITLFRHGWLGVAYFFMISGYVILMSLENSSGALEFLVKRWLRLFPAMFICSAFVFLTAPYFHERPAGMPSWSSLLPGLTFIDPTWLRSIFGVKIRPLENAYWSLYVEVFFYLIAAVAFSWGRHRAVLAVLIVSHCLSIFARLGYEYLSEELFLPYYLLQKEFFLEHFGWFAAGCAFFLFHKTKSKFWFVTGLFLGLSSAMFVRGSHWPSSQSALILVAIFSISMISSTVQAALSVRILQFFGFVSYPLYLIHQNITISTLIKLGHPNSQVLLFCYPIAITLVLSIFAYLIAHHGEPTLRKYLREFTKFIKELRFSALISRRVLETNR